MSDQTFHFDGSACHFASFTAVRIHLHFHCFADYLSSCCRVADKDWGADFRKLSAGAALVGLTLWLDHMQASFLFFLLTFCYIFH